MLPFVAHKYSHAASHLVLLVGSYNTVCMFADVSGFTALGEMMLRKHGVGGPEYLARHLNSYFSQMVKIIAGEGGDIFKFAGDAMIVLWPDVDSVDVRCRRAAQVRVPVGRVWVCLAGAFYRDRRCAQHCAARPCAAPACDWRLWPTTARDCA
jgi:class 3 adenylate cyclase